MIVEEERNHDCGNITTDEEEEKEEQHGITENQALFDSEEEFKKFPDFTLRDRYNYLKRHITGIIQDKEHIENELAKAKIKWADMELKHDNLQLKLYHSQSKLQVIQQQKSLLENELIKSKQELGDALNQAYELDNRSASGVNTGFLDNDNSIRNNNVANQKIE